MTTPRPVTAQQLAGERRNELRDQRRVRRTPATVLIVLNVLVLLVAVTAAVDLRRLDTPGGAALSWTEAVTFGDCERFLLLSAPAPGVDDPRSRDEVCRSLRERTAMARASRTRVRLLSAQPGSAELVLERPAGTVPVHLQLVRTDRWQVVLDAAACEAVGCP